MRVSVLVSSSPVTVYPDKQFRAGEGLVGTSWLPDAVYSQALDALVIACVDVVPFYRRRMLIGRRRWQPQADWWIFGGRMRKGELYQQAAERNIMRELFSSGDDHVIELDRFRMVGVYNLIWNQRAQEPSNAGCQHISVTVMIRLTREEARSISPNEEYSETHWVNPHDLLGRVDLHHPCLVQMTRDALRVLAAGK